MLNCNYKLGIYGWDNEVPSQGSFKVCIKEKNNLPL